MTTIVVGGGLAGLSAAHTVLQAGGNVLLIDKNAFMGGNSTKATSGMNGAGTRTQRANGVVDSSEIFEEDTVRGATGVKKGPCPPSYLLAKVLTGNSGAAVEWIQDNFGLALDKVSRLGGHSNPRTHRSGTGGKFPGMEITYALMQAYENICETDSKRARLITKARVNKLLTDSNGRISGVQYVNRKGQTFTEEGAAVVIATGGYGAGVLDKKSILNRVRPDLMHLPTTNGTHCTGDGIDLVIGAGGEGIGLTDVQVHPTGLVNPKDPNGRVRFLAAGALRGEGAIILDKNGKRFCNELGTRDYVSGMMWKNQGPFRLVLSSKAASGIAWHCSHYEGRGVMKHFASGADLASEIGISPQALQQEFQTYNNHVKNGTDPYDKKPSHCKGLPYDIKDNFHVAVVDPIVHYTMGGVLISSNAECLFKHNKAPIPGLYAAGEVAGGVHGKNRLGGSALLECVVFGRVAGASASRYLNLNGQAVQGTSSYSSSSPSSSSTSSSSTSSSSSGSGSYTMAEVAKHNTENDCWVVINGEVLDVTEFMHDHPGGKMAIMTFAGKDASEEFNMLHEASVVAKYAPECVIGTVKPGSKL